MIDPYEVIEPHPCYMIVAPKRYEVYRDEKLVAVYEEYEDAVRHLKELMRNYKRIED